jgi:hypothetical protein
MKNSSTSRPNKTEYDEYYETYVSLVPETDILAALQKQQSDLQFFFTGISEEKGDFRYAENKWTIKELLGHIIDGERVFSYRALRISRNDQTPLPGLKIERLPICLKNFPCFAGQT